MATTTSYTIAQKFIAALGGDPGNGSLVRAVAIWLRFESGSTVVGNNPWNLHNGPDCHASGGYCPGAGDLPGQIGNRYAGSGDKNVAVFDTLDHGIQAAAKNLIRLSSQPYGYGKVVAAVRNGDANGFLSAVQGSSWSAGHYGGYKLTNAFKTTASFNFNVDLRSVGGSGGGVSGPPVGVQTMLNEIKSFGSGFVPGSPFTTTDVGVLLDKMTAFGWFDATSPLTKGGTYNAKSDVSAILLKHVNEAWTPALADTLITEIGAAYTAGSIPGSASNPLDAIAQTFGGIAAVFGILVSNIGLIIVFGAGALLAFYGFSLLMSVTGPATFEVPKVARVPA